MRWIDRLTQSNLFPRLAWGIGIGFLCLHLLYTARGAQEQMLISARAFAISSVDRALAIGDVAAVDPEAALRLSTSSYQLSLHPEPEPRGRDAWPHSDEVRAATETILAEEGLLDAVHYFWFEEPDRRRRRAERDTGEPRPGPRFVVVVPAGDQWLSARADLRVLRTRNAPARSFGTTVFALLIIGLVLWLVRRATRWYPQFATAAERLGRGERQTPLELRGPKEVRRAAQAFNDMQARIQSYLVERTEMLAAFSHDLRTLVTRVGLRIEDHDQLAVNDGLQADLAAMTRILDEAMIYARDQTSEEPYRQLALRPLLETVLTGADLDPDEALEIGAGADDVQVHAQPLALHRAIANLVANAQQYANLLQLRLEVRPQTILIEVLDDGPGIPATEQAAVLRPYVRLERSRNRDTGGTGLGLAIVDQVVRRHGGEVEFFEPQTDAYRFGVRIVLPVTG